MSILNKQIVKFPDGAYTDLHVYLLDQGIFINEINFPYKLKNYSLTSKFATVATTNRTTTASYNTDPDNVINDDNGDLISNKRYSNNAVSRVEESSENGQKMVIDRKRKKRKVDPEAQNHGDVSFSDLIGTGIGIGIGS
eukprot:Pgem_evm1s3939